VANRAKGRVTALDAISGTQLLGSLCSLQTEMRKSTSFNTGRMGALMGCLPSCQHYVQLAIRLVQFHRIAPPSS